MTAPLETSRKYREEFEIPVVKKKNCLSDCFKKKPKHDRNFTQHEIDYTIMVRAQKTLSENKDEKKS